jgi:hypothetical protein
LRTSTTAFYRPSAAVLHLQELEDMRRKLAEMEEEAARLKEQQVTPLGPVHGPPHQTSGFRHSRSLLVVQLPMRASGKVSSPLLQVSSQFGAGHGLSRPI